MLASVSSQSSTSWRRQRTLRDGAAVVRFQPGHLRLAPTNSETLDLMMAGATVGYPGSYVFGAGQFGPSSVFGMNVRVSKNIGNPVVLDSTAFGKV
jgi:hypothetical protein